MSGTTSLTELPSDSNSNANVVMNVSDIPSPSSFTKTTNESSENTTKLDSSTINEIVSGLQKARVSFDLPNRDVRQQESNIIQDEATRPNYVPESVKDDYIKEEIERNKYQQNEEKKNTRIESVENIYDELQIPLMVATLYFLFQLPVFRKFINKNAPFSIQNDGNLNTNGYILYSSIFGISFYLLNKSINYI